MPSLMIVDRAVEGYLHALDPVQDRVLQRMEKEGEARGFPIIGPQVGRLCEVLATTAGARTVFEMGSGFGYSTYWFARAVGPRGEVVHTENDPDLAAEAKRNLSEGGLADRVRFLHGDALGLLAEEGLFDVIFIDVDKGDYPRAWDLARDHVRTGGMVITDNTLWQGKVAAFAGAIGAETGAAGVRDRAASDAWTRAIHEYNRRAFSDAAFVSTLLPLRDGVCVSLRRRDA